MHSYGLFWQLPASREVNHRGGGLRCPRASLLLLRFLKRSTVGLSGLILERQ